MSIANNGWVLVLGFAPASCGSKNPTYCAAHPTDPDCPQLGSDAGIDSPGGCTGNATCSAPTAVCDVPAMTCVQCTASEATACTGTTPVCGSDEACHACVKHTDCASDACLPDGSCGDDTNVAYVDPSGTDNATCTKAMPCTKVANALATSRAYVKFHGTTDEQVTINSQNVTLLADPGATLTSTVNGLLLQVAGSSKVNIYDLTISGASGSSGIGLAMPVGNTATVTLTRTTVSNNQGGGISSTGGSLSVQQSTISSNQSGGISSTGGSLSVQQSTISSNQGGGISVGGNGVAFDIRNNFIYRNGDPSNSAVGGLSLTATGTATRRVEFNTIVDNQSSQFSGGVACNVTGFSAPNNVIARNYLTSMNTTPNAQTSGNCTYPTSKIANDVTGLAFVHSDAAPFDYHLMVGSVAIDQATTPSTTMVDFDGDVRPQGAADDQGADELKQP